MKAALPFACLALTFLTASATPEIFIGSVRVGLQGVSGKRSLSVALTSPAEVWDLATSRRLGEVEPGTLLFNETSGIVSLHSTAYASQEGLRLIARGDAPFHIGTHRYSGSLEIWKDEKGLQAVDEVDLEEYVVGALMIEGSPSMQPEALKALAVAIRTYSERSRGKHKGAAFDMCDTTHCQGFVGIKSEGAEWAKRAQRETNGQVLIWNEQPIWALYSTDCGGSTANNEDGGAGDVPLPYLRAVSPTDAAGRPYCASSPYHKWNQEIPVHRLQTLLNDRKATRIGKLNRIAIEKSDRFGRAVTLRVEGTSESLAKSRSTAAGSPLVDAVESPLSLAASAPGSGGGDRLVEETSKPVPGKIVRTLRATTLRSLLGASVLKSTRFTVSRAGEMLRFQGQGYGHGVGMCVLGANGMAKTGFDYRRILALYYTGATLVKFDELVAEASSLPAEKSAPTSKTETNETVLYQRNRN